MRNKILLLLAFFTVLHAQEIWTLRNPLPTVRTLNSIAYGNGKLITIGPYGMIMSSTDGASWAKQSSGTAANLRNVIWANGMFVAVGTGGAIITSADGTTWTSRVSGTPLDLYGITWGANKFVVCGDRGLIYTSGDGLTWKRQNSSGEQGTLINVVWQNNQFIAFSTYQKNSYWDILNSADGINWTINFVGEDLVNAVWGNGKFVAAAGNIGPIMTSLDGISWSQNANGYYFDQIIWANNQFIAFNDSAFNRSRVFSSSDGLSWTQIGTAGISCYLANQNQIVYDGHQFVAVGFFGGIVTSPDGRVWTNHNRGLLTDLCDVAWGANRFVAVGDSGLVLASSNGIDWVKCVSGTQRKLNCVAYGESTFVAGGDSGAIAISSNGIDWNSTTINNNPMFTKIIWGNGRYVALGDRICMTSVSGTSWTKSILVPLVPVSCIAYGNNRFVAGGYDSHATSQDGINWTAGNLGASVNNIMSIDQLVWGNNQYLGFGTEQSTSGLFSSSDGLVWSSRRGSTLLNDVSEIVWNSNQFIACGINGFNSDSTIATSSDGQAWALHQTGVPWLNGIAYGNGLFVAVGNTGAIVTSLSSAPVVQMPQSHIIPNRQLTVYEKKIHFSLPTKSKISLKLFDIRGKIIATLINSTQGPGTYSVNIPSSLSFGRYVLSLRSGGQKVEEVIVNSK
jgi:hypothetical protein